MAPADRDSERSTDGGARGTSAAAAFANASTPNAEGEYVAQSRSWTLRMFASLQISAALRSCVLVVSVVLLAWSVGLSFGPATTWSAPDNRGALDYLSADYRSVAGGINANPCVAGDSWHRDALAIEDGLEALECELEEEITKHKSKLFLVELIEQPVGRAKPLVALPRCAFCAKKSASLSTGFPRGPPERA